MKNNSNKLFILSLVFCSLLLLFVIAAGTYSYLRKKTEKTYAGRAAQYLSEINQINARTNELINDKTIHVDEATSLLPQLSASLSALKERLLAETPEPEFVELNSSLINGITVNMALYEQLAVVLENPNSNDLGKSFDNIQQYKEQCISYYTLNGRNGQKSPLSKDTLFFLENSFAYINELIKLNRDLDIINTQKNQFVLAMDNILLGFKPLLNDYSLPLGSARTEKRSYSGIISSIDEDITKLVEITHKYNSLRVPDKALETYSSFNLCIGAYNKYIQSFRNSVSEESLSSEKKLSEQELTILYEDSKEYYEELLLQFDRFNQLYEKYKE